MKETIKTYACMHLHTYTHTQWIRVVMYRSKQKILCINLFMWKSRHAGDGSGLCFNTVNKESCVYSYENKP